MLQNRKKPKKSSQRKTKKEGFSSLEKLLQIKFKNKSLLEEALTHPSFVRQEGGKPHNERLEFLGDALLGLTISQLLYEKNKNANEGELTKAKSHLVSLQFLSQLAQKFELSKYLKIGDAEKKTHLPSPSMLADAFEALLGAFFLDQGYEKSRKLVKRLYLSNLKIENKRLEENYKGVLQEILQKKYKEYPQYELVGEYGPDHAKIFEVKVLFRGKVFGIGKGKSKKEAEKEAAKEALAILGRE
jgi:ribonuclease-3